MYTDVRIPVEFSVFFKYTECGDPTSEGMLSGSLGFRGCDVGTKVLVLTSVESGDEAGDNRIQKDCPSSSGIVPRIQLLETTLNIKPICLGTFQPNARDPTLSVKVVLEILCQASKQEHCSTFFPSSKKGRI